MPPVTARVVTVRDAHGAELRAARRSRGRCARPSRRSRGEGREARARAHRRAADPAARPPRGRALGRARSRRWSSARRCSSSRARRRRTICSSRESELEQAQPQAQAAAAKLHSLSVEQAGDNAYWLLASRAGTVVQLDAEPGQAGRPGPQSTRRDGRRSRRGARASAMSRSATPRASARAAGHRSTCRAAPARPIAGRIESVSDVVDPDRQTVPIRVRVTNPEHVLAPERVRRARVRAARPTRRCVQVPAARRERRRRRRRLRRGEAGRLPTASGRSSAGRRAIGWRSPRDSRAGERVVVNGALLLLNAIDVEG